MQQHIVAFLLSLAVLALGSTAIGKETAQELTTQRHIQGIITQVEASQVTISGASAKKDHGEIGIIDAENDKHIGDIQVGVRPAEILIEKSGQTLFVFESVAGKQLDFCYTNSAVAMFDTPEVAI